LLFTIKAGDFKAKEKIALLSLKDAYQNVMDRVIYSNVTRLDFGFPK
jgi:hypothetical protein